MQGSFLGDMGAFSGKPEHRTEGDLILVQAIAQAEATAQEMQRRLVVGVFVRGLIAAEGGG